ncbi:MAG: metal ABC transporter substrate-binding protein [Paracoccaceae bacterium]
MIRRPLALACLVWAFAATALAAEPLRVHAVNAPLASFAERIAGERAEVVMPVPEERDPAFWRPAVADIASLQQADLILLNGAGYAQWTTKATLPRRALVDTAAAFEDRLIETEGVTHSHGPEGAHTHAGLATHVWLDLDLAADQARAVEAALSRRDPAGAETFAANLAGLEADLAALDAEADALGRALAGVPLVASHPRYQYFARAYGFEIASLDWEAGAMPDDAAWAALDALVAETGARAMLWEAPPVPEAEAARAERGLGVVVFEPAGDRAETDFLARMRANLDRLAAWANSRHER